MAVETRSRRRRLSAHAPGCLGGDGGRVDRISGLHDDVLIQILRRLRCTAAAAGTGALSRRWRESGLWRHLPDQYFRGVAHGALESALAQVALPKLSLLDIEITDRPPRRIRRLPASRRRASGPGGAEPRDILGGSER
jgi:hypothetical protein